MGRAHLVIQHCFSLKNTIEFQTVEKISKLRSRNNVFVIFQDLGPLSFFCKFGFSNFQIFFSFVSTNPWEYRKLANNKQIIIMKKINFILNQ